MPGEDLTVRCRDVVPVADPMPSLAGPHGQLVVDWSGLPRSAADSTRYRRENVSLSVTRSHTIDSLRDFWAAINRGRMGYTLKIGRIFPAQKNILAGVDLPYAKLKEQPPSVGFCAGISAVLGGCDDAMLALGGLGQAPCHFNFFW